MHIGHARWLFSISVRVFQVFCSLGNRRVWQNWHNSSPISDWTRPDVLQRVRKWKINPNSERNDRRDIHVSIATVFSNCRHFSTPKTAPYQEKTSDAFRRIGCPRLDTRIQRSHIASLFASPAQILSQVIFVRERETASNIWYCFKGLSY